MACPSYQHAGQAPTWMLLNLSKHSKSFRKEIYNNAYSYLKHMNTFFLSRWNNKTILLLFSCFKSSLINICWID